MAGWSEGLKVAKELTSQVNSATNGHLTAGVAGAIAGGVTGGSYEAFSDKRYSSVSDGFIGGAMLGAASGVGLNSMARGVGSVVGKGVDSLKVGLMTKKAGSEVTTRMQQEVAKESGNPLQSIEGVPDFAKNMHTNLFGNQR